MLKHCLSGSYAKKSIFLVAFMMIALSGFSRKFYVSQSGDDTYTVTQAQNPATPWKTLSQVSSNIANGDSALFAKGSRFTGTIIVQSKSNIYFGVYGTGADPLFWGNGNEIYSLVTLKNCTNITFYGWNISDTTISFTNRTVQSKIQRVFVFDNGSINNVIRKCRMDRIGYGAYFVAFSNSNTMDSCDIGNLRMIVNTPKNENDDDDYGGVPVQLSSRNNIVSNNYFHDCYAVSFDYGYDGGAVEFFEEGDSVNNNVVKYNTFYDCNGTLEFGSNSGQLRPHTNNLIMYNKVINSSSLIYINNNPDAGYNTRVKNLKVYNNIIVQNVASRVGDLYMISMYTSNATAGIVDLKNSIFQLSNGASVARSSQWTGGQLIHTNNIYKLSNGSITNFSLGATEIATSGTIWVNTSNTNPLFWDFNITTSSPASNAGVYVGLTRDFNNQIVSNPPDAGILEYTVVTPIACTFVYSAWTTCLNGTQSRTYTASPNGCSGTPRADSLFRSCTLPCTFVYSAWSICLDSFQTRTFTSSPTGCITGPPRDSLIKSCNSTPDSCIMDYTVSTTRSTCKGKANGVIIIRTILCSAGPYTITLLNYSNNSTITRTTNATRFEFHNLFSGNYRLTVGDSRGRTVSKNITLLARSSAKFCR